ncbi:TRAP transporter large permease [Roseomonas alkaliterrae]|uniref:TRAP transporter large permease protein n=1 Tax=Neoroseomonas alkaliterrae TaxID=1452450 RepID=A0A840Y5C3_9PROT|nr:TRAP transporter large permease [Neoroseomonas alkaliterrae]MBB5691161.1 tripartite ATP-independent transporter DctM subunit [Neoroseomonas alkaliterrae]MBR0675499.1 TRAP transporter large permease [Neoroseomonas alkaliterrae]
MIAASLFIVFGVMLAAGVPVGVGLGLAGAFSIWLASQSIMAMPTNVYAGIAKYPLIAIPMFVLVGCVFERTGVALRLVRFASALVGAGRGALASVSVMVAMVLGGITGSGPACAAAVGQVMTKSMAEDGYPRPFIASTVGAAAAIDILIPPSIAFIVYAVLVPGVSVPAIFAAGLIPGLLAGLCIIAAVVMISIVKDFGGKARRQEALAVWQTFREAIWGLLAPVLILGGMRVGLFTPTEAAVVAVFFGLFVGFFVYRTLSLRDVYEMLVEAGEISAVILIVVALATVFAWSTSTLGIVRPIADWVVGLGFGSAGTLVLLTLFLVVVGMFLDGISIFLIMLPVLLPIAAAFQWDLTWFGVVLTMMIAIGQFTPPMAVNLMVSCRIAGVPIESTIPWVAWLVLAMGAAAAAVMAVPDLALWLPRSMGL